MTSIRAIISNMWDLAAIHRAVASPLTDKKILLGITGGIAAYKSAELVRLLIKQGAVVRVVMTRGATEFVQPLTFQALSGNEVHLELLDTQAEAAMGHIELARWADSILIAPASANFLAKLTHGFADDLLSTLCLAFTGSVIVAPSMNQQMWLNAATQANLKTLSQRQTIIFKPESGDQACGEKGPGRLMAPSEMIKSLELHFSESFAHGLKCLITAGPTQEHLDPIRFLTNHSSGRMGYALATAAVQAGMEVTLVSGPTHLDVPLRVSHFSVVTAQQMLDAANTQMNQAPFDLVIGCAAVADFRPVNTASKKLKKGSLDTSLLLEKNPDIIAALGKIKPRPFMVGFAAETHDLLDYALVKLKNKKLDMIVANDVSHSNIGMNNSDNQVKLLLPGLHGQDTLDLGPLDKHALARQIILAIYQKIMANRNEA